MQGAKEKANDIAASARSGLEKSKATAGEKVERVRAKDPEAKEMATEKKEQRIQQAEMNKQAEYNQNKAAAGYGVPGSGPAVKTEELGDIPGEGTRGAYR